MRKKMITRTISITVVTALILDKTTAEPGNRTYEIPGTWTNEKILMNKVSKMESDSNIVVCDIVDVTVTSQLMGVSEEDFIKMAVPVNRNNTKIRYEEPKTAI